MHRMRSSDMASVLTNFCQALFANIPPEITVFKRNLLNIFVGVINCLTERFTGPDYIQNPAAVCNKCTVFVLGSRMKNDGVVITGVNTGYRKAFFIGFRITSAGKDN